VNKPNFGSYMFLAAAPLVVLVVILLTMAFMPDSDERHEEAIRNAPEVERYGLANFATLDTNSDGIISEQELLLAGKADPNNAVLKHMYEYRDCIGHVVDTKTDTYPVTDLVPMPDGNGGFYFIPTTRFQTDTTNYYGISKQDLETYKTRLPALKR